MKLTLGISPCPNDTFIFDALINGKIDSKGLSFEVLLEDVQTLNHWALAGRLDMSKISYGALPLMLQHYIVLQSGGALGKGVGPLLISKYPRPQGNDIPDIDDFTIAIPGENTTAHALFSLAYPAAKKKVFMNFSEIEAFLLASSEAGKPTAGVIIHENRFTYQKKGLHQWLNLGEYWEKLIGYPIPLGGIVARRKYSPELLTTLNSLIKQSVEYAFEHYPQLPPYVLQHAQEMEEEVMRQHIDLYVNQYSLNLGQEGMLAVQKFIEIEKLDGSLAGQTADVFFQPESHI